MNLTAPRRPPCKRDVAFLYSLLRPHLRVFDIQFFYPEHIAAIVEKLKLEIVDGRLGPQVKSKLVILRKVHRKIFLCDRVSGSCAKIEFHHECIARIAKPARNVELRAV